MDRIIETAKTDPCLYNALYDAVSGSETYRKILLDMIRNKPFRRFWRIAFGSPVRNGKSEPGDRSAMDIKIRTITVHDVQAILRINEKTMGKKLEAYWEGKVANQIQCDPLCNLVAEVDGEVVGFVMGDTRGWEFNMPLSGWIEMMGVEPAYQGKGVGRRLLESLFAYFAGRGIESVHALISWDDSDLVDYFRSMDFKRGEFIHLQKNLSPNPQSQQGGQKS
jgi:ribosomal protein S18 acetylase RimI-like enzyme